MTLSKHIHFYGQVKNVMYQMTCILLKSINSVILMFCCNSHNKYVN